MRPAIITDTSVYVGPKADTTTTVVLLLILTTVTHLS
jgi:hypothetical protein